MKTDLEVLKRNLERIKELTDDETVKPDEHLNTIPEYLENHGGTNNIHVNTDNMRPIIINKLINMISD